MAMSLPPYSQMESIYNIVPQKVVSEPRPPMFRSKIPGKLPPTASTFNSPNSTQPAVSNVAGDATNMANKSRSHAEFGKPLGSYKREPIDFTRKFSRSSSVPTLLEVKRTNPDILKPTKLKESRFPPGSGVPKRGETPIMNLVTSKNFVVANAVETILAQPKRIPSTTKDYLKKEDYGKVPQYLHQVKQDIQSELDYIKGLHDQDSQARAPPVQPINEEERLKILEGLKAQWEAVNTQYQGLTHITILESEGLRYRKEKYEAELSLLERDIERLSKNHIMVDLSC